MTIYTQDRYRGTFLEEIPAPLSTVAKTAAQEALTRSPLMSITRSIDLRRAHADRPPIFADEDVMEGPSRPLSADEARDRIKEEGVKISVPDEGIQERALELLIQRKKEERRREDVFNRAPGGFAAGSAQFGAALAGSMLDPINVAASFIPVVGPARYSAMLARAGGVGGRTATRVGVGAVEGAAGAALVEPIVFGAAHYEQANYDLVDSMLNIALGTALGAGLHVGAGGMMEAITSGMSWQRARATEPLPRILEQMSPEARESGLRAALAQGATGRNIDVRPVFEMSGEGRAAFDSELRGSLITDEERQAIAAFTKGGAAHHFVGLDERVASLVEKYGGVSGNETVLYRGFRSEKAPVFENQPVISTSDLAGAKSFALARNEGLAEMQVESRTAPGLPIAKIIAPAGTKVLDVNEFGGARPKELERVLGRGILRKTDTPVERIHDDPFYYDVTTYEFVPDIETALSRIPPDNTFEELSTTARASFKPENVRLADFNASREADTIIQEAPADDMMPQTTLDEAMEDAEFLARALGDEELVARELAEFDDLATTADEYGKAVRAAAACQMRRGAP